MAKVKTVTTSVISNLPVILVFAIFHIAAAVQSTIS